MLRENRFRNKKDYYRPRNNVLPGRFELYKADSGWNIKKIARVSALLPVRIVLIALYSVITFSFFLACEDAAALGLSIQSFSINRVLIKNNVLVPSADILESVRISTDKNILTCNLEEIKKRVEKLANIKNAEVRRLLPGFLEITVEERIPFFRIENSQSVVDCSGMALKADKVIALYENLPSLSGIKIHSSSGNVFESDMNKFKKACEIMNSFEKKFSHSGPRIEKLASGTEWIDLFLENGIRVRLPVHFSAIHFERLKLVLADLDSKGITAGGIDLQFNDVVVEPAV